MRVPPTLVSPGRAQTSTGSRPPDSTLFNAAPCTALWHGRARGAWMRWFPSGQIRGDKYPELHPTHSEQTCSDSASRALITHHVLVHETMTRTAPPRSGLSGTGCEGPLSNSDSLARTPGRGCARGCPSPRVPARITKPR
ncbi:hypothetical protein D623_10011621 [Myotis brandtii]|uniref:Uncharacterized protein n=1 Tax=Myotis brandtii TaxID=109478 RepID=S7Q0J1_MYOBR|nr:hypothetical protein D623_10011621 [Myotis brandtii]